jgi:hypothetical protein
VLRLQLVLLLLEDAGGGEVERKVVFGDDLERLVEDLPELDGLVVGGEEEVRGVLAAAPLDLVDFLFDFEGFEVVEFWFVRLEFGVEFVLAGFFLTN